MVIQQNVYYAQRISLTTQVSLFEESLDVKYNVVLSNCHDRIVRVQSLEHLLK